MKKDDKTERIWNGKRCLRVTPREKKIYELMWKYVYEYPDADMDSLIDLILNEDGFREDFTNDTYNEVHDFLYRLIRIRFIKTVEE